MPGPHFRQFGPPHLAAIALAAALAAGLTFWARRSRSRAPARWAGRALAVVLLANEAIYLLRGLQVAPLPEFARHFLPLHICGVAVFLTAWVLLRPNPYAYEIAYFWGLGGTVQAILTPSLTAGEGFPSYWFFTFFIAHGGTVAGVVLATWGLGLRPARGAVVRVVVVSNLYMLAVAGINALLGANYMFLCAPPAGATPLFFLPWPWYIAFLDLLGVAIVLLLCLPFAIEKRLRA